MQIYSIALFCGSAEGNKAQYKTLAAEFGAACAQRRIDLVYGGARIGLMVAAVMAAQQGGSKITGIAPRFFSSGEVLADNLEEMIMVDSMSERKQLMENKADAFVILPGSYGTMDEFFEVLTDAQLGLHHKPVCILNAFGFYTPLLAQLARFRDEGFLHPVHFDLLLVAETVEDVFMKLENYRYNNNSHWLDKIKA
ncbi:MAG: TIGR00730 family Rossman fold protein [Bacteroidales bacterium]|nr:TIGR00730 family Rossman fold protein [Bacteroidales bacterium]